MRATKILVATALAAAASVAQASAGWQFTIAGTGTFTSGGTEGCSPANPEQCPQTVPWLGTLLIVTQGAGDGIYGIGQGGVDGTWEPGGIERVSLSSSLGSSTIDAQGDPNLQFFPGTYPYAVTVAGGHLTDIQWTSLEAPESIGFLQVDGFAVTYTSSSYHGPSVDAAGTLTAIPEPDMSTLSLAGLVLTALALRRRPPARGRRRSSTPA